MSENVFIRRLIYFDCKPQKLFKIDLFNYTSQVYFINYFFNISLRCFSDQNKDYVPVHEKEILKQGEKIPLNTRIFCKCLNPAINFNIFSERPACH